jgi:hypothetical protein
MQTSQASQMAFDNGHLFGDVARTLMGTGHLIGHVDNIGMALKETTGLLPSAKLLFEPAFSHHGVVSRADGFERMHGGWHMIEAKASTRVKDYYLEDCAVQAWVANGAGATVKKISLAYISRDFVYQGDNDYRALMVREDVTDQVFVHVPQVSRWVRSCTAVSRCLGLAPIAAALMNALSRATASQMNPGPRSILWTCCRAAPH